jgi:hypothetical protein
MLLLVNGVVVHHRVDITVILEVILIIYTVFRGAMKSLACNDWTEVET